MTIIKIGTFTEILRRERLRVGDLLLREPALFWRENVVTVVILLRVSARMPWWREREALTSFNKDNSAIFFGESKVQ